MADSTVGSVEVETAEFRQLTVTFFGGSSASASSQTRRRVVGCFGLTVLEIAVLWLRLRALGAALTKRVHLLWALYWLRTYNTEEQCSAFFRVTEKTFREHVQLVVEWIANLNLVRLRLQLLLFVSPRRHRFVGSGASRTGRTWRPVSRSTASTFQCRTSATRGA
jgi:hypothetical protein